MFQFISQCKLCDILYEANLTADNQNLSKLGRVPLGNITYQTLGMLFSDKNIFQ